MDLHQYQSAYDEFARRQLPAMPKRETSALIAMTLLWLGFSVWLMIAVRSSWTFSLPILLPIVFGARHYWFKSCPACNLRMSFVRGDSDRMPEIWQVLFVCNQCRTIWVTDEIVQKDSGN